MMSNQAIKVQRTRNEMQKLLNSTENKVTLPWKGVKNMAKGLPTQLNLPGTTGLSMGSGLPSNNGFPDTLHLPSYQVFSGTTDSSNTPGSSGTDNSLDGTL
jgi:hypothetical protein